MNAIDKDEYGIKIKFPDRTCESCDRYPCFEGIKNCRSNFALYGCYYYRENRSQNWI